MKGNKSIGSHGADEYALKLKILKRMKPMLRKIWRDKFQEDKINSKL